MNDLQDDDEEEEYLLLVESLEKVLKCTHNRSGNEEERQQSLDRSWISSNQHALGE